MIYIKIQSEGKSITTNAFQINMHYSFYLVSKFLDAMEDSSASLEVAETG